MKNLYVDIHALQTVPASNLNRDDTNSPKKLQYGGVTRSRVSSQSWKRAMREAFQEENNDAVVKSFRTKRSAHLLADELMKANNKLATESALELAQQVLKIVGITAKLDSDSGEMLTDSLVFFSTQQLRSMAKYAVKADLSSKESKTELKSFVQRSQSLDLALFGRMVAEDPSLTVFAASQVAHAFSTHEIVPEYDYYTALDDFDGVQGAAMLGTMEYNSSTLYRYANLNLNLLKENLSNADVVAEGAKLFIKDFILSMPSGKQTSYANKTLPQYVLVEVREDTPVNLASAFEEPVVSNNGFVTKSIEKLEKEDIKSNKMVKKPLLRIVLNLSDAQSQVEDQAENLDNLLAQFQETIKKVKD